MYNKLLFTYHISNEVGAVVLVQYKKVKEFWKTCKNHHPSQFVHFLRKYCSKIANYRIIWVIICIPWSCEHWASWKKKVKQKSSREGCVIAVVVVASWKKKIAIFDLWVCMKMSFVLRILIAYYSSMFSLKVLSTKNPCCCWKKFLVSKNVPCSFYNLSLLSFWIKRYKFLYSSKNHYWVQSL